MPLHNGISSIIHLATSADTSGYTYTQVYASVAASPIINGTTVVMTAGLTIDILVNTISSTANVFVIGDAASTTDPGGKTGIVL